MKFHTSFELLGTKTDAVVLWETSDGIPMFGYRPMDAGVCYYLNTWSRAPMT